MINFDEQVIKKEKKRKTEQLTFKNWSREEIQFFLNLPPRQALDYLKAKESVLSDDYLDIWEEVNNSVFTVAGVTKIDLIQDIKDKIEKAMEDGQSFDTFQKNIEKTLEEAGWSSGVSKLTPSRLQTIYRTNLNTSFNAGRWQAQEENKQDRPYLMYISMHDSVTRESHLDLDKKCFHIDDPIWNSITPPNGYNCRCSTRALSEKDLARKGIVPESSDGRLSEKEVVINQKKDIKAIVTTYTDENGNEISPDPGWNYNPGKKDWKPDLKKYDSEIRRLFK